LQTSKCAANSSPTVQQTGLNNKERKAKNKRKANIRKTNSTYLCWSASTAPNGTIPFRAVAAFPQSGAKFLQCPHHGANIKEFIIVLIKHQKKEKKKEEEATLAS
jgi:hypothetical protein